MSMQIDPSHLPAQGTPVRAPGESAAPRSPQANTSAAAPGAAGTPAATGAPPVAGTVPVTAATPGTPAAPAPAPVATAPAQTTQVHISPQARQTVGEAAAALQRQGLLLEALDLPGQAPGAPGASGASGALPAGAPGQALAAALLASATSNAAHSASSATGASALLSTTATGTTPAVAPSPHVQALAAPAGTAAAAAAAAGASAAVQSAEPTAGAAAPSRPPVVAGPQGPGAATGTAPSAAPAWPNSGVSTPLQSLLSTLVQQSTAAVQAQRVLAVQPWPAALLAQVDGSVPQGPSAGARTDGPPPLQTWLVREGVVQTPDGPRGVSLTVRVPAPWLQALEQTQAAATPTRSWQVWLLHAAPHTPAPSAAPLQAAFAGPSQALPSGTYALALESAGGGRTSALLVLEVQPMLLASAAQAGVYGREVAQHLRQDPWLQMAALQASGQAERDEDRARHGSAALCDTSGCPYLGRAACVQPFCAALQGVPQVAPVQAPGAPDAVP